jgi:MarR family transcriptional regulator, organic hydroperoxide resistance regulator
MSAQPRSHSSSRTATPRTVAASIDSFRRITRALRLAERRTQFEAGLSAAQLFVLHALADGNETSLSELAERTMTDRSSVAAVVDRLFDAGYVVRGVSRADRRRAAIVLTGAGRAVLARAPQPPMVLLVDAINSLEPAQRAALATGLAALSSAMGVADEPAGMLFEEVRASTMRRERR